VTRHTRTIRIADIGVTVRCATAIDADTVSARYAAFVSDAAPLLTLDIVRARCVAAPAGDEGSVTTRGGIATLAGGTFAGTIDLVGQRAELQVGSGDPTAAVDYCLRVAYAQLALQFGGLLVHAAGIARGGRAFLFLGPSGTGKTTVARMSSGDLVLNDDLVLLMPGESGWNAFATPFWNPTQVRAAGATHAPLAAIFRLVQSTRVQAEPLPTSQAVAELAAHAPVVASDPTRTAAVLRRAREVISFVPAYRLQFRKEPSFWAAVEAATPA
jgi:Cdc6-like AAA superfamily ATPase